MAEGAYQALSRRFLGQAPAWYKRTIAAFLILNPVVLLAFGPFVTGWLVILEFIFSLALALQCHPLPAGGLIAIEAVLLGLTSPAEVYHEIAANLPVLLLLIFMVAAIFYLKELLHFIFSKIILGIKSNVLLSLLFCLAGAVLSAFLDALTVTAVMISVAQGLYDLYRRSLGGEKPDEAELEEYRGFLRGLMMHGVVGTALGGVMTLVGEPQNLIIASAAGWNFGEFFLKVAPVSLPVFAVGLGLCALCERFALFGYGKRLPGRIRELLRRAARQEEEKRSKADTVKLYVQGAAAILLVAAMALHVAEVGLIGLGLIILLTSFLGVIKEHDLAESFTEAMPFTALLAVFFAVVAAIHTQGLFQPVINYVLALPDAARLAGYYLANGLLSMVSDNVFVATVYLGETKKALDAGLLSKPQFDLLAATINTGTNIPSIATPNGQAAFLFLLTSQLAPLLRLSYGRMVMLALPYTVALTLTGLAATLLWLK